MLGPERIIADPPLGYTHAFAAGGDDWRMMVRPYWLWPLPLCRGDASFAAARRLFCVWPMRRLVRLGGAIRRTRRVALAGSSPTRLPRALVRASPVQRWCSSPCFPDTATGPSNTSPEVLSPTAHSSCVALSRGSQPLGTVPLRRFPTGLAGTTRPCGFRCFAGSRAQPVQSVRWRVPRPGAGHASQVPCKRCSATRASHRASSQPGCHIAAALMGLCPSQFLSWPRVAQTSPLAGPTCRFLRAPPRSFSSRDGSI
jgi:hypothetical protein